MRVLERPLPLFVTLIAVAAAVVVLSAPRAAFAGPPFVTDDPEPVEHRHWEVYLASQQQHTAGGLAGTAPHLEVNFGAAPELQLHLIAPLAFTRPDAGPSHYGPGDVELGAKYRFVDETDRRPQVGTFPLALLPTGDSARGLGDGHVQLFLPLWAQKTFGPWTTYGGGGLWIHPGDGNHDWVFVGAMLQRRFGEHLAIGVEAFHGTSPADGVGAETRAQLGVMVDFTETHHLLLSAGSDLQGDVDFAAYAAYQLTFGPAE